ncbi:alpha/beta hydrolase [Timonella sp. A28]|uniref:alpha/beta hydrolase n=1 Tax=Timonella sp. A28 TaxID=3442640 RepID=UPI003EB91C1B
MTTLTVILPETDPQATQRVTGESGAAALQHTPVLYLLHGLDGDDSVWTRRTLIERYASEKGLAVVMPKVGRSFYCDEHTGQKYWTFLTEELPNMVARMFNVSTRREDTFVAGLSMGGYGAFKLALRHPQRFAAAASLSGALNVAGSDSFDRLREEVPQVWGPHAPAGTHDDLISLLRTHTAESLPQLYQACGTEDFLYQDNLTFAKEAQARGINLYTDLEGPGNHDWMYWDTNIKKVLDWLPLAEQ